MSAYENLRNYIREEQSHFGTMQKYFERYKTQQKDNAMDAVRTKQELAEISSLQAKDQLKKLSSWLSISYEMYSVKEQNAEDIGKRVMPIITDLLDRLQVLKEQLDEEQKKKLDGKAKQQSIAGLKAKTKAYVEHRTRANKMLIDFHAKSCLNEYSQYLERLTNLMQKLQK